ncbi:NAD-P-binding protein [Trametes versicolor FP-101664 SS1]|uniref:NAD-P-binding protein n=1 Tax=Trametes versicolor (strain FP-101664) TaxID=717944 RepID=UPI0004624509|nr:NAD-P-binding protein [Trametes versicolor FP-101664 SS1]EIW58515.1 NAD-P-binding protein [Trametes versicolor FP-101664 SS1]
MSNSNVVLITGASGFIGAHVVVQLLDLGYRVKGTARGAKLELLREKFGANPNFEVVEIRDIATDDFTGALEGVSAVVHLASPLAGRQSPEEALNSAVEGTLNILRQCVKAKVSKVVFTSSWATTLDPNLAATFAGVTFTEKDWGAVTREDLLNGDHNPLYVYCGIKTLAELAAWQFAKEHSVLDLASINPPFVYGKPVDGLTSGTGVMSLGTNALIYQLIAGEPGRPLPPQLPPYYCNVRDVARAHVLALGLPRTPAYAAKALLSDLLQHRRGSCLPKLPADAGVQGKRFIVAGPGAMLWVDAVKMILVERPALKDRLPRLDDAPPLPGPLSAVNTTRANEVLGMKEYAGLQETLLEAVDALTTAETTWE